MARTKVAKLPATVGRPSTYTPEIGKAVCDLIATGSSLRTIGTIEGMPTPFGVFGWLWRFPEFEVQYSRAVSQRAHWRFEEMADIIQELRDKKLDPNSARVILDTWKWQCGKEQPKRYGEKLELSGDANNPLVISVRRESSDQPKTIDVTPSK